MDDHERARDLALSYRADLMDMSAEDHLREVAGHLAQFDAHHEVFGERLANMPTSKKADLVAAQAHDAARAQLHGFLALGKLLSQEQ